MKAVDVVPSVGQRSLASFARTWVDRNALE
jgi:hypothetical protein